MVQLKLAPVFNENLFTKHYLEERVGNLPEWQKEDEIKAAFDEIKEIYERKKSILSSCNESQLRNEFINPVLKVLGFQLGVEAPIQHSAKQPDYALFKDEDDKMEAYQKDDSEDFYQKSIAVADAKAWGIDFDKKTGKENVFENRNPSFQIYYYLDSTPPDWGFLTNGKKWRLYYDEIGLSQWFETYYEVDLIDILEKNDLESFKYFYLFFRKQAFTPVGDSFLDQAYEGSKKYAQEIGENLEENIYRALLWMAEGYFAVGTNELEKTKENVKKVHENSLIFLYRLLFLLYADSRGMLGTDIPKKYEKNYSFSRWIDDILKDIDNDQVDPTSALYHWRLKKIFRLVREGSESIEEISEEEFHIPAYNGGLFSQEKYPFLNKKKIRDKYLAKVVELLVRPSSEKQKEKGRIDFSDLSLRHLGGIYEGLLEYKLKLAEQDLVAEKKRGTLKWIPALETKKDFLEFDEDKRTKEEKLYLATDKGERKATGSYYTPDYIVKYIVENTVGPVIEDKLENAETDEEKKQAILSTKVLDPAMGSGHFLVETIDFLASRLVEFAENGGKKRDIDWAKRKVARNCIYGVDVNPLATELAKVSLWLNTMAEDKPLSFLDHHLKTGNSLIGADVHRLDKHPDELEDKEITEEKSEQLTLMDDFGKDVQDDIKELLREYQQMLKIAEERPEDIKEQEKLFEKFEEHSFKKKFDVLADVQIGYYFGNEFSKTQYEKLLDAFRSSGEEWKEIMQAEWVKKSSDSVSDKLENNLSDEKRFFHWKLEFPEVFFNIKRGREKENPGFDAIFGNPPYGKNMSKFSEKMWNPHDLYAAFVERSYNLLSQNGYFGFIIPVSWQTGERYGNFRKELLEKVNLEYLINLPYDVFSDAYIDTCNLIFSKKQNENSVFKGFEYPKNLKLNEINISSDEYFTIPQQLAIDDKFSRLFVEKNIYTIQEKLKEKDINTLGEITDSTIGILASKFDFNSQKKGNLWLPYFEGNVYRYQTIGKCSTFVDFTEYLDNKPQNKKYYENERILIRRIVNRDDRLMASYTNEKFVYKKDLYGFIITDQNYNIWDILGLLNSSFFSYLYLSRSTIATKDDFRQTTLTGLRDLPVVQPDALRNKKIKKLAKKIYQLKEKHLEEKNSFLNWLSREWGTDIEEISRKTYLKEYWKHGFNENRKSILNIAKHNSSKIDGDPSSRNFQEKLDKEWEASAEKINPLIEEIQNLDNQIDAIVFGLYDLNDEEVITVLDSFDTEEELKQDILEKL